MEIKKETRLVIQTTDGFALSEGRKVVFKTTDGKCFCGTFVCVNGKGALQFRSLISADDVMNIMPKSIERIYLANIDIIESEEE